MLKIASGSGNLADNPSPANEYRAAVEFLIRFFREHEKHVDKAVDGLVNVMERMQPTRDLIQKMLSLKKKLMYCKSK